MQLIKKYRLEIALAILLTALYFFLRIYNILHLPIFTDEAIYIRWSQIAKQDANWRFISLTDGKQPLFIWASALFLKFIHDPLLASRFVSVVSGFFTLVGLFFVGRELFKNRFIGFLTAFLYVLYPFALVYDRMALYESMVNMWTVWGLYLSVLLVRKIRLDLAFVLGMVIGGGALTKGSAFFIGGLLPFSVILFNFKQKKWLKQLVKWASFGITGILLGFVYYNILRLSPFFHIIKEKTEIFVYPFGQWIQHPFTFFYGNLVIGQWNWLYTYFTIPFILLLILGLLNKRFFKEKTLLLLWFIIPFVYLALFGRTLYPRYTLFMTMSLLPLVAYALFHIFSLLKNKMVWGVIFLLAFFYPTFMDYKILTDFSHAPIPKSDLDQYINDWPSGGGVKEAIKFFQEKSSNQKIYIGTEGTFGLMPFALEMYLVDKPNITLKGFWPIETLMPQELLSASKSKPTYMLFYQPCTLCKYPGALPNSWSGTKVLEFKKAENKFLTVYQINK